MAKLSTVVSRSPENLKNALQTAAPLAAVPETTDTRRSRVALDLWSGIALGAVAAHVLVSLILKEPTLNICCAAINFFLLVVAAAITTRNAIQNKQSIRLFWTLLATAYWLWAIPPCVWFYYTVLRGAPPKFLFMTFPWFLHIVLMIAAVAARPHLRLRSHRPYGVTLNFLMVLFLLVFFYAYLLFPYGYVNGFPVAMRKFAAIYSAENLIFLLVLGAVIIRSQGPWRSIYWHLLGASTLYALESEFAHLVFASHGGFTDGLVAVPFTAAAAWFVWVSVKGHREAAELAQTVQPDTSSRTRTSLLAMAAVVAIPVVGVFELLRSQELPGTRMIRLFIVLTSVALLAVVAFMQEHLSNREVAFDVSLANDRLRLAVESGKSVVWDWDLTGGQDFWFGDLQTMFGIPSGTFQGKLEDLSPYVHPEDREQVSKAIRDAIRDHTPYEGEFRIVWPDGTLRYATAMGKGHYAPNGQPERMMGITVDITERKQAERELRELSGHLIAAQEEERMRIARELHDDMSQRLALLAIEIQTLNNSQAEVPANSLQGLWQRVNEISEDIHSLSHRLHPALLDRVGLVPALRRFCRELPAQTGIKVTLTCRDISESVPKQIATCLFRVAQEAMANVVKHSGATEAVIELTGDAESIRLRVVDAGVGFEHDSSQRHGLGLVSMRERVRLVGGELTVRSEASQGTVVQAEIPLPYGSSSEDSLEATA